MAPVEPYCFNFDDSCYKMSVNYTSVLWKQAEKAL